MITAVLSFLAVWLIFSKPLPKSKIKKNTFSTQHITLMICITEILLLPNITGLLIAGLSYVFLPKIIKTLPTRSQIRQQRQIEQELDLAIDLISAALSAGLSVLSSLDAVSKVVQPALGTELVSAANRIQWGSEIEAAFTAEFKVIGSALARAMDHGVGAGKALAEIAARTREERKQDLLRKSKKLSVTLALPVALLMLPGFILLGVVPMIVPALTSLW